MMPNLRPVTRELKPVQYIYTSQNIEMVYYTQLPVEYCMICMPFVTYLNPFCIIPEFLE